MALIEGSHNQSNKNPRKERLSELLDGWPSSKPAKRDQRRREKGLEEGRDEVEEGKEFEKRRRNSLKRVGKQL